MSGGSEPFDPFSLPYAALEARVVALGGAKLHALRWFRALHRTGDADPGRVPELGRGLTRRLQALAQPRLPALDDMQTSADGTVKLRARLADGQRIESVLIPDGERLTLCVSSQAGCAAGCRFCATGTLGLARNLTAGEIVGQAILARAHAARPVTNVVFMGMGEPLQNWPAVRDAVDLLNAPNAHNLSRHKITVSTSGVLPRLEAVVREARTGLALSLHATGDAERTELMPLNRVYPLAELMAELRRLARDHGGRIMIQYLLLAGRNDTPAHARRLWAWLRDWPCHVNVLEYNAVPGLPFARSDPDAARRFKAELLALGARVYHRESRGRDIDGACGQLANAGMGAAAGL
jgi:23S rRNA (adenine2503-C2)-methyltransferase